MIMKMRKSENIKVHQSYFCKERYKYIIDRQIEQIIMLVLF